MVMQAKALLNEAPVETLTFPERFRLSSLQSSPNGSTAHAMNERLALFGLPYDASVTLEKFVEMGLAHTVGVEAVFHGSKLTVPVYVANEAYHGSKV